jgi:hypothetical protein
LLSGGISANCHRDMGAGQGRGRGKLQIEPDRNRREVLLDGVAADPAPARLVLVEALASGSDIRAEHVDLIADAKEAIERFLDSPEVSLQIPATALLGAVVSILSVRLLDGEGASVGDLHQPLMRWVNSYTVVSGPVWRSSDWERIERYFRLAPSGSEAEKPVTLLPRGSAALSRRKAHHARRQRIIKAGTQLVGSKGYARLTVAEIIVRARISRGVFYASFRSKEDVFLAAQTEAM